MHSIHCFTFHHSLFIVSFSEVLFEASLFGIKDPISGVSESIMLGQKTKRLFTLFLKNRQNVLGFKLFYQVGNGRRRVNLEQFRSSAAMTYTKQNLINTGWACNMS